jgi:hypothetical protein
VYLHDYSVLVPEAIATLEQREQVLAGVHMLTDELREKHAGLEKLVSSSSGITAAPAGSAAAVAHERKVQQLQAQVVQLQVGGPLHIKYWQQTLQPSGGRCRQHMLHSLNCLLHCCVEGSVLLLQTWGSVLLLLLYCPQDQLVDARQHYQRLCERNKAELVRLNLERRKDFHAAMVTFANVQVQFYNAAAEVWVTASQQLQVSPAAAL